MKVLSISLALLLLCSGTLIAKPLPTTQEYQKVLRAHLATLKVEDFVVKVGTPKRAQKTNDQLFIDWMGTYTNSGSTLVATPLTVAPNPDVFTLSAIEGGDTVMRPTVYQDDPARLAAWNPMQVFDDASLRALRLRAYVGASLDLMMLDAAYETPEGSAYKRADFLGGTLIGLSYSYLEAREYLPENVRQAYEAGLRRMFDHLESFGHTGLMTDMDLQYGGALTSLREVFKEDPKLVARADKFLADLMKEPYMSSAGYWRDCDIFDASYNGISLYFATFAALSTNLPAATEGVERGWELRAYLSLPEQPDVHNAMNYPIYFGPSHFSSRTGGSSPWDQWGFRFRDFGASMVTDWALPTLHGFIPSPAELQAAQDALATRLEALAKTPAEEKPATPWKEVHWNSVNYGLEHYKPGFYDRIQELVAKDSPLLKRPFERPEGFIKQFGKDFVIAKFDHFGAIIHTGYVTSDDQSFKRPRGFSGGSLSAFWTAETGPVILGLRKGLQGAVFDTYEEWRSWPVNAISGLTQSGMVASSARCLRPEQDVKIDKDSFTVTMTGDFPQESSQGGSIHYTRTFKADATGLAVTSKVSSDGSDRLTELYETIPLFLRDERFQRAVDDTVPKFEVEFEVDGHAIAASENPTPNVTAVVVKRQLGAIRIVFAHPRQVHLGSQWKDGYQSVSICQNLLIDHALGEGKINSEVTYRIEAVKK